MSFGIDYKITREKAKDISKEYCKQNGYSYEMLSTYDLHYGISSSGEAHWIWSKPYEGPIKDENGCFLDLQAMPDFVLKIACRDGKIIVEELDHIDLIQ